MSDPDPGPGPGPGPGAGIILVFDLDQTLIDSGALTRESEQGRRRPFPSYLNITLIETVLRPAVQMRGRGVDAILLLTNNSDTEYIVYVLKGLNSVVLGNDDTDVFDSFMDRYDIDRHDKSNTETPTKSIEDVKNMLREHLPALSRVNLPQRIYFFDDNTDHVIGGQIPAEHYFKIQSAGNPGFTVGNKDTTDYTVITRLLQGKVGGMRKRKRGKKTKKRLRRRSRHRTRKN